MIAEFFFQCIKISNEDSFFSTKHFIRVKVCIFMKNSKYYFQSIVILNWVKHEIIILNRKVGKDGGLDYKPDKVPKY